jgi:hypothetical protein
MWDLSVYASQRTLASCGSTDRRDGRTRNSEPVVLSSNDSGLVVARLDGNLLEQSKLGLRSLGWHAARGRRPVAVYGG